MESRVRCQVFPWISVAGDLSLLPSLTCGGFQHLVSQAVLWFSSGGTTSVLHRDAIDNLNCMFDGSKEIVFIDKVHNILPFAGDLVGFALDLDAFIVRCITGTATGHHGLFARPCKKLMLMSLMHVRQILKCFMTQEAVMISNNA